MRLPIPEQREFAATVGTLLNERDPLGTLRKATGPRTFDIGLWSELTSTGLLDPVHAGDVITACLVAEALGRRAAPVPYLAAILGSTLVTGAGGACAGLTTVGLLGPDGLCSAEPLTWAGGRVSGLLPFVPDADAADSVVVAVAMPEGLRLAIVDTRDTTATSLACLDATQPLSRVTCSETPATVLPADDVDPLIISCLHLGFAIHAATLLGLMTWLLDTTVSYTKQRVQFGLPIAARQAVKHRCASMRTNIESSRSMVLELADVLESDDASPATRELAAAMTKAWVSDAAEEVAAGALQLHGGIGFTWEHDLHHYFKRCTAGATLLGSASYHRGRVASLLAESALDPAHSINGR